jgi:hypothetical protein
MFAQSEHLTFKGVPIDGTLSHFTYQLTQKGFEKVYSQEKASVLSGDFAGYSDCTIYVYTLDNQDLVHTVGVQFPSYDSWSLLEGNYNNLKEMLTIKYGKPKSHTESFQRDYPPRDDNSKLHELKMDRCNYISTFETDNGTIVLKLSHESVYKCYVILGYVDAINGLKKEAAAIDDL